MARKENQFLKLLQLYPLRKPPCILLWWRRSMLKDVAAATETKHLCLSQQGTSARSTSPGLNGSRSAGGSLSHSGSHPGACRKGVD